MTEKKFNYFSRKGKVVVLEFEKSFRKGYQVWIIFEESSSIKGLRELRLSSSRPFRVVLMPSFPEHPGLSTKLTMYWETVGVLRQSQSKLSRGQTRKRQERQNKNKQTNKKAAQWLDPKIKPISEVPQTEKGYVCVVGICHHHCSKEKAYTNLNPVVNVSLMPSQHPLSTSSFR